MLGAVGLRALMDQFATLVPAERLGAIVDRLDRPGTVLHDDLTILTIDDGLGSTGGDGVGAARREATGAALGGADNHEFGG